MSYYPLFNVGEIKGWLTLSNFAPNNWEVRSKKIKFLTLSRNINGVWKHKTIHQLLPTEQITLFYDDFKNFESEHDLLLVSMTEQEQPEETKKLPLNSSQTITPNWRATIGLSSEKSKTSFQGEVDAFPEKATLLSFFPFFQAGNGVSNKMILVNVVNNSESKEGYIEFFKASEPESLLMKKIVNTNCANIIDLDEMALDEDDMPFVVCKDMTGIPLFLSIANNGGSLSFEHTHPPASYTIHGNRWGTQSSFKSKWFSMVNKD